MVRTLCTAEDCTAIGTAAETGGWRGAPARRCIGRNIVVLRLGLAPAVDVGQRANRGQVLGRAAQHLLRARTPLVVLADLDQRAAERDARGNVGRMPQQAGAAGFDRFGELPRRRYSSASAAKEIDAGSRWTRRFSSSTRGVSVMTVITSYGIIVTAVAALVVVRPALSVTVSVT